MGLPPGNVLDVRAHLAAVLQRDKDEVAQLQADLDAAQQTERSFRVHAAVLVISLIAGICCWQWPGHIAPTPPQEQ